MKKYTTQCSQTFYASSHTAAHRHLCSMLNVGSRRSVSAFHQGVEVHASLYDGRDFIRLGDGRVRTDWTLSKGKVIVVN